jgi:regulator of protease activity HflC (stomatin/prohibitin superfamily)
MKEMTSMGYIKIAVIVIAALFFLDIVTGFVFMVPAGSAGIVFNRIEGGIKPLSYGEGWHFMIPIIETASIMDCRVQRVDTTASAASKDLQTVNTDIALNYHADKSKAHVIYQQVGFEYDKRVVEPAIEESVRSVTAKYTAEELVTKRELVASDIKDLLTQKLSSFNIMVDAFNVMNFKFSDQFEQAIEGKQTAEQNALKEKNILTQKQIQAQQVAAEAEGQKNAMILQANGTATATVMNAQAEARAIQVQGDALKQNPDVLKLRQIEKWNGQVPSIQLGSNSMPLLDMSSLAAANIQKPAP